MARATALTYEDLDRDLPPKRVEGEYTTKYVDSLGYVQHLVDGVPVDPSTVEVLNGGTGPEGES